MGNVLTGHELPNGVCSAKKNGGAVRLPTSATMQSFVELMPTCDAMTHVPRQQQDHVTVTPTESSENTREYAPSFYTDRAGNMTNDEVLLKSCSGTASEDANTMNLSDAPSSAASQQQLLAVNPNNIQAILRDSRRTSFKTQEEEKQSEAVSMAPAHSPKASTIDGARTAPVFSLGESQLQHENAYVAPGMEHFLYAERSFTGAMFPGVERISEEFSDMEEAASAAPSPAPVNNGRREIQPIMFRDEPKAVAAPKTQNRLNRIEDVTQMAEAIMVSHVEQPTRMSGLTKKNNKIAVRRPIKKSRNENPVVQQVHFDITGVPAIAKKCPTDFETQKFELPTYHTLVSGSDNDSDVGGMMEFVDGDDE